MEKANRPGLPASDALAGLADRRVVAVDERNAGEQSRFGGEVQEVSRAARVGCQRLLADDVLACRQRCLGERNVQVVRRADVHDVDVRVAHEVLGGVESAIRVELGRRSLGRFP